MPNGFSVMTASRKYNGERREQNGERDFVGRFLAAGTFHQLNHAIQKTLARDWR